MKAVAQMLDFTSALYLGCNTRAARCALAAAHHRRARRPRRAAGGGGSGRCTGGTDGVPRRGSGAFDTARGFGPFRTVGTKKDHHLYGR